MTAPQPEPEPVDVHDVDGGFCLAAEVEPADRDVEPTVGTLTVLPLPASSRTPQLARALVAAVAGPVLVSYAATVAVLALVTAAAGAGFALSGALRSSVAVWPAIHQVPLSITTSGSTATLGVLPLLPTLALLALVARSAGRVARRLDWTSAGQLGQLTAAFAAGHGVLGMTAAIARPADAITVSPVHALFGCAAVAAIGAGLGGVLVAGPARVASALAPAWAVRGMLAGLAGTAALLAAGAVITFCGLLLSVSTVHELFAGWEQGTGDAGAGLGLTLLSVAYLPNAAVASVAWITGPGFSVGAVSISPFATTAGPVPPVPLLAALPEPGEAPWRVLVLALPAVAGVLVGQRCRQAAAGLTDRLHAAVLAGTVVAAACFVLAVLAGGRLGGGAFDPVRIPPASLAVAVFVWIVLPAAMLVALSDRRMTYDGEPDGSAGAMDVNPDELCGEEADALDVNPDVLRGMEADALDVNPDVLRGEEADTLDANLDVLRGRRG